MRAAPLYQVPHTFIGAGRIRFRGTGQITLRLEGRGQLAVRRGPTDSFHFEGRGQPRHLSSARVAMRNARGEVVIDGVDLDVEIREGRVRVTVKGHFEVEVQGSGMIASADGRRRPWGPMAEKLRVAGGAVVPAA